MMKCNLIVPGFAKSGTISLHEYLALHPDICMFNPKETNFHITANWQRGEDWYNSLFRDEGRARLWYGESSTAYSVWEPALERIKKCLRQPRFIVMLRHPVQRLISHYKGFWARNLESRLLLKLCGKKKRKVFLFGSDDLRERITPTVLKDGNEQAWLHWTRSQKVLWYWKTCNQEILRNIQRYSYLQVKYEDFFDAIKGREQL
jgi:hypothetical protein